MYENYCKELEKILKEIKLDEAEENTISFETKTIEKNNEITNKILKLQNENAH
ncbi:hypothetical protein EHP00_2145 [Ecytonucleospora hepatopenaei]|uniref:Uncharacterized protein n=1 Tax=Ecytonucleospora hepatopenaei TaxID=646526 RepID=A0A1W0E5M5_9MICR|nr:hypothetical protein EHP00_2145 [Ecytonucleospora hepatopenaei]